MSYENGVKVGKTCNKTVFPTYLPDNRNETDIIKEVTLS
jgi:hypothetical protein